MTSSWAPVVVLGAPRSGTNLLRDLLTEAPGVGTWPCDEINFIWRHGNVTHPDDRLTPEMARPDVAAFIRGRFASIAAARRVPTVVEKTCANTLRVPFVDRVLPEARYVVIVRDGIDAAASAMLRWTGRAGIGYVARKARYVPPSDLARYAVRFARNRVGRRRRADRRLRAWGPILGDMAHVVASHPLDEVCAIQWRTCVETADADLLSLEAHRVHRVRYEALVTDAEATVWSLAEFLGLDPDALTRSATFASIDPSTVGKGRRRLDADAVARLEALLGSTLRRFGYPTS